MLEFLVCLEWAESIDIHVNVRVFIFGHLLGFDAKQGTKGDASSNEYVCPVQSDEEAIREHVEDVYVCRYGGLNREGRCLLEVKEKLPCHFGSKDSPLGIGQF